MVFLRSISVDKILSCPIVKPKITLAYEADRKNWLARDKFSERTPCFFKPEFVGTRGVWLMQSATLFEMRPKK